MYQAQNSENNNLNFQVLSLTFANFSRLTAVKTALVQTRTQSLLIGFWEREKIGYRGELGRAGCHGKSQAFP